MIINTMNAVVTIGELEKQILVLSKKLAVYQQLTKIQKTHAWKKVIEEGFFADYAADAITDASDPKKGESAIERIKAISTFGVYIDSLKDQSEIAEMSITAYQAELDRLRGDYTADGDNY